METVKNLEISLKSKKYKIFLGNNLLNQIDIILKNHLTNKNIVILYDKSLTDKLNILEFSLKNVDASLFFNIFGKYENIFLIVKNFFL